MLKEMKCGCCGRDCLTLFNGAPRCGDCYHHAEGQQCDAPLRHQRALAAYAARFIPTTVVETGGRYAYDVCEVQVLNAYELDWARRMVAEHGTEYYSAEFVARITDTKRP